MDNQKNIKELQKNIVFKNNFIEVQNNDIILRGEKTKYLKIFINTDEREDSGSAILCINENKEILIINNYRYAINKYVWEIPRGGLNLGETYEECAKREIKEECNIQNIENIQLLGKINTDSGILASEVGLVLININNNDNKIILEEDENIIQYKWIKIDELKKEILKNNIKDSFLISALFFFETKYN